MLRHFHGPGIILAKQGRSTTYVGYRGRCAKCAPEAVRPASMTEQLAATSAQRFSRC